MVSIVWRHTAPTAPNRQRNCCRKNSTVPHRREINLHASCHAIRDESTIQSRRLLQIRPEQPTPSLQNCHAHSLKTAKTLTFDLLTLKVVSESLMTWATSAPILYSLPRPLFSRLRPDVRDRQTSDKQTDIRQTASSLNAPPRGRGHNNDGDETYIAP